MKVFVRIAQFVLLLLAALGVTWAAARFAPMPAQQRAALRAMEAPWRPPGTNAFDDLWLIEYRVPPAQRRALVDADLRRGRADGSGPAPGEAAKAAGMPSVALSPADRDRLCRGEDDCLAKVTADRAGYRALVARNTDLIRNVEGLRGHGHVRIRSKVMHAIPRYQFAMASDTWHALRFAEGDTDGALTGACADFATWRRLAANNDSLIGAMVATMASERLARSIAQMAAAQPRDTPWPAGCAAALVRPQVGEGEFGQALAGEHRYLDQAKTQALADGPLAALTYDRADTRARSALRMQGLVDAAARAQVLADRKLVPPAPAARGWDWRCVGNMAGCMVESLAEPAYFGYAWRMQDHRARLQLMSAVAWLRVQPPSGESIETLLRRWPGQQALPARQVEADDAAGTLRIAMFDSTRGDYWTVPAPGSRADPASAPAAVR